MASSPWEEELQGQGVCKVLQVQGVDKEFQSQGVSKGL